MPQDNLRDYYEILEVPVDASHHDIVKAYHRAKETYDVDSAALYTMFSKEEAAELRSLVEEAYQILSNHAKRKEYDENFRGIPNPDNIVKSHGSSYSDKQESKSTKQAQSVPEGYRKGTFGVYEIDPELESSIESETDFDGHFLKKIRDYQKISLEQMSKETRISRAYINAVETNDYSALPAAVFVRGFIVQLCKVLNLDGNKVASSYMSKFVKDE